MMLLYSKTHSRTSPIQRLKNIPKKYIAVFSLLLIATISAAASLNVHNQPKSTVKDSSCQVFCNENDGTSLPVKNNEQRQNEDEASTTNLINPSLLLGRYSIPAATSGAPVSLSVSYVSPVFSSINITRDIPYKYTANKTMDPDVTTPVTLLMNLYEPVGNTNTDRPVIIFVYGGGMCVGDRLQQEQSAIKFAKYGYVTATIDYRMRYDLCGISDGSVDEEDIPAYYAQFILSMKDVAADILDARAFLVSRAGDYKVSSTKAGVVGWSVGGTTSEAILLENFDNQRSGVGGIVTLSGFFPVDPANANPMANLGTLSAQRPLPPVLVISYDVDEGFRGVDADAGRDCQYVRDQGASCTYIELPGEGHPMEAYDHVDSIIPFLKNSLGL